MNTISIGGSQRPLANADAEWIRHQFDQAVRAGGLPCIRVSINTSRIHLALQTPSCGASGGGGGRPPNSDEAEIFKLWNIEGLGSLPFAEKSVVDFVDRVKRLIR